MQFPTPPYPVPSAPPAAGIGDAVLRLGFNLIKEFRKQNPNGNVVFSPLSISAAFSLVFFGAKGTAKSEMESVFGFQGGQVPMQLCAKAAEFGEGMDQIATIANRAYIDQGLQVLAEYRQAVGNNNFRAVTFAQSVAAQSEINSWVETVTQGLIHNIIPQGFITQMTRMVLVNAIYFKGEWETAFPKDQTRQGNFRGPSGTVTTEFMHLNCKSFPTKVIPDLDSRVIQLPYKGNRFSMYIILPNSDDGFTHVESNLSNFGGILAEGLFSTEFNLVKIPKWSFEQSQDTLKHSLQALGLDVLFTELADLSAISTSEQLMVSEVVHKAKIVVDEEGTEAAAATAIGVFFGCAVPRLRTDFIADHPFIYIIADHKDGTIFFQGTVTSP